MTTPTAKQQPKISINSSIENKKVNTELGEEELKKVSGGLTVRKAGKGQQEF